MNSSNDTVNLDKIISDLKKDLSDRIHPIYEYVLLDNSDLISDIFEGLNELAP